MPLSTYIVHIYIECMHNLYIIKLFSLQFDLVSNISLTEVTKSGDPTLCVAKQMPVNFNEKYSTILRKGSYITILSLI